MKKLLLLACLTFISLLTQAATITIYHTSDVHGYFYSHNGQGGFAALASVIKHGPQPYLLLDSGDFTNGTAETRSSKGIKAVQIMNTLNYDAATIGNHEFDFKDAQVANLLKEAKFPILAANFFLKGANTYPDNVQPYKIFNINNTEIAVIGLANYEPNKPALSYDFNSNLIDTLEKNLAEIKALPNHNIKVVIVLAHYAIADEKHGTNPQILEIAKKFGGRIHVVLGGHAHKIVQNYTANKVLFVESGKYLQNVSKITIQTDDKTGKVISSSSELIPLIIEKTGEDKEIKEFADSLREPGIDIPLGINQQILSDKPLQVYQLDTPVDNWIADLVRQYTKTQIAIHNTGVTRIPLPQGVITKRDLIELYRFDDDIVKMEIKGKLLKELVSETLGLFNFSGLEVEYYIVNNKKYVKKILVNGKELNPEAYYTVATSKFLAFGANNSEEGLKFKEIPDEAKNKFGDKTVRQLMEEDLQKAPVKAPQTGRIRQVLSPIIELQLNKQLSKEINNFLQNIK